MKYFMLYELLCLFSYYIVLAGRGGETSVGNGAVRLNYNGNKHTGRG